MNDRTGTDAETQIRKWLDRPQDGYSTDRLYAQMSGYYQVSRNPADFKVFKSPNEYYIESKETEKDRFDFSMISDSQHDKLLEKSKIAHVYGLVIVLFTYYKRAFCFHIEDIKALEDQGIKSLNILKIAKWTIPYKEIRTIPNNRKKMLDYEGEIEEYI